MNTILTSPFAAAIFIYVVTEICYIIHIKWKYRYKLYQLRARLRKQSFEGKIESSGPAFKYLDISISRVAKKIMRVDIFDLMLMIPVMKKKRSPQEIEFFSNMEEAIEKNEHANLIYNEFGNIVFNYITHKHYIIFGIMNVLMVFNTLGISFFNNCKTWLKKVAYTFRTLPEITATQEQMNHYHLT